MCHTCLVLNLVQSNKQEQRACALNAECMQCVGEGGILWANATVPYIHKSACSVHGAAALCVPRACNVGMRSTPRFYILLSLPMRHSEASTTHANYRPVCQQVAKLVGASVLLCAAFAVSSVTAPSFLWTTAPQIARPRVALATVGEMSIGTTLKVCLALHFTRGTLQRAVIHS